MPNNSLPAGSIIAYAGVGAPQGNWLRCNGAILKGDQYPDLYAAIANTWGDGDGSARSFHLPDFRGVFLRGWSDTTGFDPDADSRSPQHPGGKAGNSVGSVQLDAMQGHHHNFSWSDGAASKGSEPNNTDDGDRHNGFYATTLNILGPSNDGTHGDPRISSETRPKNANVAYFISF